MARPGFLFLFAVLDEHPLLPDDILASWVRLTASAARARQGGRFTACKAWTPMAWARIAGVGRKDVEAVVLAGLAQWDGDDLVLAHYDHQGEQVWEAKSLGGKDGAERKRLKRLEQESNKESLHDTKEGLPPADGGRSQAGEVPRHSTAEHSKKTPNTSSPGGTSPPGAKAPATGGGARKVSALEPMEIVRANRSGVLAELLSAFRANTDPTRRDDWLREADLLSLNTVATILYEAYDRRAPVREPSGFRRARAAYEAATPAVRQAMTERLRKYLQPAIEAIDAKGAA